MIFGGIDSRFLVPDANGKLRVTCRNCSNLYSVRRSRGMCPECGFDPFLELMHALDPLGWTARLSSTEN